MSTTDYEPTAAGCPGAVSPEKLEDTEATRKVPGSLAPSCNILMIWTSMLRWILSSSLGFAKFFHSFLSNSSSRLGDTVRSVWPMAPPYPEWLLPELRKPAAVSYRLLCQQKAVNLMVLMLSWLHMKKPSICPPALHPRMHLSGAQWSVVRRLERLIEDVSLSGEIGPKEMGRTAARLEGLEEVIHEMHVFARKLAPQEYLRRSLFAKSSPLKAGCDAGSRGSVIGKLKSNSMVLAKEVEPERLSFPKELPAFDPTPLLPSSHQQVFLDPVSLAIPPAEAIESPPKVQVRAAKHRSWKLLQFLDEHRRLKLAPESKIRRSHLCGAFSLLKDQLQDRLILDARPPNSLEPTYAEWTKTLGAASTLLQVELEADHNLYLSGTDLRDYYYAFRVSSKRSYRNALCLPISPAQASALGLQCFNSDMWKHKLLYPCLDTLAMGDNNAVELGQMSHVLLGLISQCFSPHELVTVHGRAPRGAIACGIVIDDLLIAEQIPTSLADESSEGARRFKLILEEYLQRGLTAHPKKTFEHELQTECWGAAIDGKKGLIRASSKRLVPLIRLSCNIARLKVASVALLEVVCGSWVAILQYRRRMMCLLDHLYLAQQGREQEDIISLSAEAVDELWALAILGPLAVTDIRAQSIPELYLSDASEQNVASVRTSIPKVLARELQRHCLARGSWTRLLSPWDAWLKGHSQLYPEDELPSGVPLVSHPVWLALAQTLNYKLNHKRPCNSRAHINLLELKSIIQVEQVLSMRRQEVRYLLGADSQVALAAVLKGRSSSGHINSLLQQSLAVCLGAGLYGNFGYVPSLANVSDDPTRDVPIRPPCKPMPEWLSAAWVGDFRAFDKWLDELGFSPLEVASTPFSPSHPISVSAVEEELIGPLRAVQKADRMEKFLAGKKPAVSPDVSKSEKNDIRGQKEAEAQTKTERKRPKNLSQPVTVDKEPNNHSVASTRAAPPLNKKSRQGSEVQVPKTLTAAGSIAEADLAVLSENEASPFLSADAVAALQEFPGMRFLAPGGRRLSSFRPRRAGVLDLFSGKAGVARQVSRRFRLWVLTFDFTHGDDQNLLDEKLQDKLRLLVKLRAFLGLGAAPECASFSRAVHPAVRSRAQPLGLDGLTERMARKVEVGNLLASFLLSLLTLAISLGLSYWLENPDGSFLWLLPDWLDSGLTSFQKAYRFDQCRYSTPWRKRTRVLLDGDLAGERHLCQGGHSHLQLRGRSTAHGLSWTRVAQEYPKQLCIAIAKTFGKKMLSFAASCARSSHSRIGEASNPGPAKRHQDARDPRKLQDCLLVEPGTAKLQERIWKKFQAWIDIRFSEETGKQIFLCPSLGVQVLKSYGETLYAEGAAVYELRHLIVIVQQLFPLTRPVMGPAWTLLSKWEELQPLVHRVPLAEILFRAMFATAVFWKWYRWAGTLLIGFEGIARIGEMLKAQRSDLILPSEMVDSSYTAIFMKIRRPKTRRRGKGRIQHLKISNSNTFQFVEKVFADLEDFLPLFPLSSSAFRNRWDKILDRLGIPKGNRPTPASIRGGGAIAAYRKGESISSLCWRMRLVSHVTLESYLQELAAENFLITLSDETRGRIQKASTFFSSALSSLG